LRIYAKANLVTLDFLFIVLDQRCILLPVQTILTLFTGVKIISRLSNVNALQRKDIRVVPFWLTEYFTRFFMMRLLISRLQDGHRVMTVDLGASRRA
jgi:hypothetical protein